MIKRKSQELFNSPVNRTLIFFLNRAQIEQLQKCLNSWFQNELIILIIFVFLFCFLF